MPRKRWVRYGADLHRAWNSDDERDTLEEKEERKPVIVRAISSIGIHRIELRGRKGLKELKNELWRRTGISPKEMRVTLDREGREKLRTKWDLINGIQVFVWRKEKRKESQEDARLISSGEEGYDSIDAIQELVFKSAIENFPRNEKLSRRENVWAKKYCYHTSNKIERGRTIRIPSGLPICPQNYAHFTGNASFCRESVNRFLGPWIATRSRLRRYGLVIGKMNESEWFGLHIFESVSTDVELAERVAKQMGLEVIGCICTCFEGYSKTNYIELFAKLQTRYHHQDRFLSIIAFDSAHLFAFQVHDQVAAYLRDSEGRLGESCISWEIALLGLGVTKLFDQKGSSSGTHAPIAHREDLTQYGLFYPNVHEKLDFIVGFFEGLEDARLGAKRVQVLLASQDFHFLFALGVHFGAGAVRALTETEGDPAKCTRLARSILNESVRIRRVKSHK